MKNQCFNPFLPLTEYIADGEPHVFGERVYLFGSHDESNSDTFCSDNYVFWSAPLDDLSDWSNKGISFSSVQDPLYTNELKYLFAPDVVQGNDGRFYLYYALSAYKGKHGYDGPVGVAVCDTPDGKYEFLGHLRKKDGTVFNDVVLFDPALINDNGVIRFYSGTSYFFEDYMNTPISKKLFERIECGIFSREMSEIEKGITGAFTFELEDDMLTVKTEPKRIVPTNTRGTDFKGHGFFEASSIRKFNDLYYFIYSSRNNHELCYATSSYPDKNFVYRGTIVSNGDVGYKNREKIALTGNNHGSIEKVGDDYYIFYHRMTNKSTYSRQACVEKIEIKPDGTILQVPMSSTGFGEWLVADGSYSAGIATVVKKGKMPHTANGRVKKDIPFINERDNTLVIENITNNTVVGFNSVLFNGKCIFETVSEGDFNGIAEIFDFETDETIGRIAFKNSKCTPIQLNLNGKKYLSLKFKGKGKMILKEITFNK